MPNINLIGTEPDQIPTNADLGTMAFQDQDYVNVGNLIVATVDVTSEARIARFSTANATITGGSITGVTIPLIGTLSATNFSTGNALITGGSLTGITGAASTWTVTTGLSAANVQLTGTASSWMRGVPIETANLVASGGSIGTTAAGALSRVANVYSSLGNFTNFSAANAQITGTASSWMRGVPIETANLVASGGSIGTDASGAVSRLANVYATLGDFSGLNSANVNLTGGNINLAAGNITAGNIFITSTSIQNYEYNAVTTKSYVDTLMITFGS